VEKGEGGKPALSLAPNPRRQTVQSIEQWVSAFQVFVATYSENVPQDTPALMKYGSIIRELATLGANWKFYDENFRSIRQTQGAPWDQIHAELWLRSHSFRAKLGPQAGKSKQTGQRIPKGSHAPGVPTNTNVSSAGTTTQFLNVNNLIPNHQQGIQGPNQLLVPIMPLLTAVLPTEALPTPVNAKSLEVYLTGYQEVSRKHLLDGFLHGSRLHFQDLKRAHVPTILFQRLSTPTLLIKS